MKPFESACTEYSQYRGIQRYRPYWLFQKRVNLWHSLFQSQKIEPFRADKYVLTMHDIIQYASPKYRKRIDYKVKQANAIVYISEYAKKTTHQTIHIPSSTQEKVIYNGITYREYDTSEVIPVSGVERPYIYSIGNFEERKNFHSLVQLLTTNKEFNLILSGNNCTKYGEQVKALARKYGVSHRVFFTGGVSEAEKQYYIKHATAFAFPSTNEGFGLPVLEAMQMGRPVFLSPLTSLPEVGGDVAYYFPSFDAHEMNRTLIDGLHHFETNKIKMEQRSVKRANLFSWDNAAKQYLELYKEVLNS